MTFRIPLIVCFQVACFLACVPLHADIQPQVMISARFVEVGENGTDILSAPRITTRSGQQASISIGQEVDGGKTFDGVYLSLKATVQSGGVSLEGVAFVGEQAIDEEGMEGKVKEAWAFFAKKKEPGSSKPNSATSSFANEVEMRGMFQIKGKPPRISLHLKNGGSFWLELGQTRHGINLAYVDVSNATPHAILEKEERFARVDLKKQTISDVDCSISLEGGGQAFLQETQLGQSVVLALDGDKVEGTNLVLELLVEIVDPEKLEK